MLELPRLELRGSPQAMGRAHGEALRPLVQRFVAARFAATDAYLGERGVDPARFLDAGRACLDVAAAWDPQGHEEHVGMAEGAGVDPARLYAATQMTDVRDILAYPIGEAGGEGCSTVLIPGGHTRDGKLMAGQTWDLNPEDLEYVIAVHRVPADGVETWSVTCAGALTLMGMNQHGLAVGTNNIKVRGAGPGAGYLSLLHRAVRCRSVADAARLVAEAPRAAAHVYWFADATGAVELECSRDRAVPRSLETTPLWRTNHCLDDLHRAREGEPPLSTSTARFSRVGALLEEARARGGVDVEALRALFADRADGVDSICRLPEDGTGSATNACMVAIPEVRALWACRGPAPRGRWQTLDFERAPYSAAAPATASVRAGGGGST